MPSVSATAARAPSRDRSRWSAANARRWVAGRCTVDEHVRVGLEALRFTVNGAGFRSVTVTTTVLPAGSVMVVARPAVLNAAAILCRSRAAAAQRTRARGLPLARLHAVVSGRLNAERTRQQHAACGSANLVFPFTVRLQRVQLGRYFPRAAYVTARLARASCPSAPRASAIRVCRRTTRARRWEPDRDRAAARARLRRSAGPRRRSAPASTRRRR